MCTLNSKTCCFKCLNEYALFRIYLKFPLNIILDLKCIVRKLLKTNTVRKVN